MNTTDTSTPEGAPPSTPPSIGADTGYPRPAYSWWVVFVLLLAMIVAYIDRHIVSLLVEPIKGDLGINDAQAGWLFSGFAIFYAVAGLPIGRWADRSSRRMIITLGILAWSAMTVACGLARNFPQLLLARIGVGVGEATISPATNSLVGDYFPRKTIPFALSVFQMGAIIGSGLAFLLGGIVVEIISDMPPVSAPFVGTLLNWQLAFIYVSVPGVLVVLLMATVREPLRRIVKNRDGTVQGRAGYSELWSFYRRNRMTIFTHHVGLSCVNLLGWAFVFWTPSFFERVHGLSAGEASQPFGLIFIIFGPMGALLAPYIAHRLSLRGRKDANVLGMMTGSVLAVPIIIAIQMISDISWVWLLYAPALAFINMPFGLGYGALTVIVPANIRAQATAIFALVIAAFGMGLGPVIAGAISDNLFTGADGVRYSLMTVTAIFGPLGIGILWLGRKPYGESLTRADEMHDAAQ